jgi:hypothetical protein
MQRAVAILAVVQLVVIGVSHTVRPTSWVKFFTVLSEKGHAGVYAVAFLSLWFGSIIVAFHEVWSGIPLVLTLLGWSQVLKAIIYFTFPEYGLRRIQYVSEERAWTFTVGGVFLLLLGALLAYDVARPGWQN